MIVFVTSVGFISEGKSILYPNRMLTSISGTSNRMPTLVWNGHNFVPRDEIIVQVFSSLNCPLSHFLVYHCRPFFEQLLIYWVDITSLPPLLTSKKGHLENHAQVFHSNALTVIYSTGIDSKLNSKTLLRYIFLITLTVPFFLYERKWLFVKCSEGSLHHML